MIYLFIATGLVLILTLFRPNLLEGFALTIMSAGLTIFSTNPFIQIGFGVVGVIGIMIIVNSVIGMFNGNVRIV